MKIKKQNKTKHIEPLCTLYVPVLYLLTDFAICEQNVIVPPVVKIVSIWWNLFDLEDISVVLLVFV